MADIFPKYTALLQGSQDMVRVLAPEYTNIARAGDLGGTVLNALMFTLATDVLGPAERFTDQNITTAFKLLRITRRAATFATALLVFTLPAARGVATVIPAGSVFSTQKGMRFSLNATVTILAGALSASGLATCTQAGIAGNVDANSIVTNTNNVAFISGVTNPARVVDGEAAESDTDIATRGSTEFRQSNMNVRESDFVEIAERVPGVLKASCLPVTAIVSSVFLYQPGAVTVLALPNDGGLLTAPLKAAIKTALIQGLFINVLANNALYVDDFARTTVNIAYTVKPARGVSSSTVTSACDNAIRAFVDPRSWPSGRTVKVFEVGAVLEGLSEVDSVDALSINGANALALDAFALPQIGTLSGGTS